MMVVAIPTTVPALKEKCSRAEGERERPFFHFTISAVIISRFTDKQTGRKNSITVCRPNHRAFISRITAHDA